MTPDGTVYNADFSNYRVQAWAADGDFLWSHGSKGGDIGAFSYPADVALDSAGLMYVTDGARVQVFDPDRSALGQWQVPDQSGDFMDGLAAIAVTSDGSVYVSNPFKDRIFKLRLR